MVLFFLFLSWIATALLTAIVAADKNHSGAAWGFAGLLFGPIALIATVGLADRRQHQLLRRIADALSGEMSSDGGTRQNELSPAISKEPEVIEGPIEGADDYNICLENYRKTVGSTSKPVYAKSKVTENIIWLMDKDGVQLAQFKKSKSGEWTMPFWLN